jgi:hypothetical protein
MNRRSFFLTGLLPVMPWKPAGPAFITNKLFKEITASLHATDFPLIDKTVLIRTIKKLAEDWDEDFHAS